MKALLLFPVIILVGSFATADEDTRPKTGSLQVPNQLEGTEIVDKRGASIPLNLSFTNQDGNRVNLSSYFSGGQTKPVILTLGYFKCPMLCNLVMNNLLTSVKSLKLTMGKDYRIVSVSVNPSETKVLAHAKRETYLKSFGVKHENFEWDFLVGNQEEIKQLAQAVGFGYRFDKTSGEYAHSAGIFIVSPQGMLTQTIFGLEYDSKTLKLSLLEAGQGKVGSLLDRIVLSCFNYDPDSHRYGVYVFGVMRLAGILTVLFLGGMLLLFWRQEKRIRQNG